MKLNQTKLTGVYIIENFLMEDARGSFTKTFHTDFFSENNLCTNFKESYFSKSHKDVIRGMHFQLPPYDHEKLIYVAHGEVLDVVVDLRKKSPTYGESIQVELTESNHRSIYIPKGLAHGFKTKKDNTIMVYNVATIYSKEHDFGIKYDSFGFDWGVEKIILSERDQGLMSLNDFEKINPFI